MAGLFQNFGWKLASGASVLSIIWIAVGASPVIVQHKLISELVVEAGTLSVLVNEPPRKTHEWLQHQFRQNDLMELDARDFVQVSGYGPYRVIDYSYEVQRPLFRNINYVLHFSGSS